MRTLRLCVLFLLASVLFAQRGGGRGGGMGGGMGGGGRSGGMGMSRGFGGGGFRGGGGMGRGFVGGGNFGHGFRSGFGFRSFGRPAFRSGFGFGFRRGYGSAFWGYPFYGSYGYSYPYYSSYPYSYPYAAYSYPGYSYPYYDYGPAVIAQDYSPPPAVVQEYAAPSSPGVYQETIYLIALTDHRILAAIAYWVDGGVLHYVTRQHEQRQISLGDVDRSLSQQLNRDRHVDFRLPH